MRLIPPRQPPTPSPPCGAPLISFLHPEYPAHESILLRLPPLDLASPEDVTDRLPRPPTGAQGQHDAAANMAMDFVPGQFGVHYGTALIACQIIAVNSFEEVYLSYDRAGSDRVSIVRDGLLTRSEYYVQRYHSEDDSSRPFPITPTFEDWRFPHNRLPQPWASMPVQPTSAVSKRCIISGSSIVENCHVVPRSASTWFQENGMRVYANTSMAPAVDVPNNLHYLRCDLHNVMDRRAFSIVPKPSNGQHVWAVHFVDAANALTDPATEFHNQEVQLESVSPQYLFARFAYTIFSLVKSFVLEGTRRRLAIKASVSGEITVRTEEMDQTQTYQLFGGGGSRSSSPRKRTRGSGSHTHNAHDADESDLPHGDDGYTCAITRMMTEQDEEDDRGRKRVRDWVLEPRSLEASSTDSSDNDRPMKKRQRTVDDFLMQSRTTPADVADRRTGDVPMPSLTTSLESPSSMPHASKDVVAPLDTTPPEYSRNNLSGPELDLKGFEHRHHTPPM